MAKIDIEAFRDTLEFLFSNEFKALMDTIKKAKKDNDQEQIMLAKGYGMGVKRAQDIVNQVLKDVN